MISTVIDERLMTVSVALALVRSASGARQTPASQVQKAAAVAQAVASEPLIALLRRHFRGSREFLVYGHALALGPAPEFERASGSRVPTYLMAMPTLLGAEFPRAMRSFYNAPAVRDLFVSLEGEWAAAAEELEAAIADLSIGSVVAQWFPSVAVDVRLMPDLTGLPGQVVTADAGEARYFACAPSTGKCRWDPAHIGAAMLLEIVRPLTEGLITPEDASRIASQQGLAFILAQVRANGQPQSLKQSFLLSNPDFRTRLVEVVARALVAMSLGRSLGKPVARAYLNEQESAVGGDAVERVMDNMLRHLRLAPRTTLSEFLSRSVAELEAPLFARAAGN